MENVQPVEAAGGPEEHLAGSVTVLTGHTDMLSNSIVTVSRASFEPDTSGLRIVLVTFDSCLTQNLNLIQSHLKQATSSQDSLSNTQVELKD